MTPDLRAQYDALSDHLAARRGAILQAWRQAAEADPRQTTAHALTRGQFEDHVPEVLDAFERRLRARPGGSEARAAGREEQKEEVKHGLHRWQQGYRLQELMREWGQLQLCLFDEFNTFATQHPDFDRATLAAANRQMLTLVNEAIMESAAQYERMQQAEAAGRLGDLEVALAGVNEIERRRAALIHEAVHDLNSNVFGVAVAAKLLGRAGVAAGQREEFASLLQQGVLSITAMLGELTELARLEAGRERREIAPFDASALVAEVAEMNQPVARDRGLFLDVRGPTELPVDGDPAKVRRLLQNLVQNALAYTPDGGVVVSWGEEKANWWLKVADTGPGLASGPTTPLATGLKEATASARESDEKTAATEGERSQVLTPPPGKPANGRLPRAQPGEGIGLSIVKRLCELLDASLEMASSAETGTTFRIVLPSRYPA